MCPTSSKVHTTRTEAKAIYNYENTQVILFDTPGLVTEAEMKRHKLSESMNMAARRAIASANLIAVVHDVTNSWTRNQLDKTVVETLEQYPHLPSILILNKVDLLRSKRLLLDLSRVLTCNTIIVNDRRYTVRDDSEKSKKFEKEISRPVRYKVETSRGWPNFTEIFMVSALHGEGVSAIMVS